MKEKVILAYSGGLDTTAIIPWLKENFDYDVICVCVDCGQGSELDGLEERAKYSGAEKLYIEDLTDDFCDNYIVPCVQAHAVYENKYLLGTSMARPAIAKRLVEIASKEGATAICHGATGKGNDQVRFEIGAYALNPNIKVIAPWREWDLNSREKLLAYAEKNGIDIAKKPGKSPYSLDANFLHISYEGLVLEDPAARPQDDMWRWSLSPQDAPNEVTTIEIEYKNGDPVALNGKALKPHEMLSALNELGAKNGIGRLDIVENRYVGMKSRGCYETPGGTIMLKAHRAIESITLDREAVHLKDELMPRYAKLIYNGYWYSPERLMLQAAINESQKYANGKVRLELYKGNVTVIGRESANDSLFNAAYSTFEEDSVYDQKDANGFIKLNALRFIIGGKAGRKY